MDASCDNCQPPVPEYAATYSLLPSLELIQISPAFNALGVDPVLNIEFLPSAVVRAALALLLAVFAAVVAAAAAF